jgi:hypothetical protein
LQRVSRLCDFANWCRYLFVAWLIIGLPSMVVGYGFGGGELVGGFEDALSHSAIFVTFSP